jgi:hypothetical protein
MRAVLLVLLGVFAPLSGQTALSMRAASHLSLRFDQVHYVAERPVKEGTRVTLWRWPQDPARFDVWLDREGEVILVRNTTPTEGWANTRFNGRQPIPSAEGRLEMPWGAVWDSKNDYLYPAAPNPVVETLSGNEFGDGLNFFEINPPSPGGYPDMLRTPNALTPAGELAWGGTAAIRFYQDILQRNGPTNLGRRVDLSVHVGFQYDNAFWAAGLCDCAFFGSGSYRGLPGQTGFLNMTSLDVVAHELAHGTTQYTSGFEYWGEAGGLNEATSDIIGKATEWWAEAGFPAEVPTHTNPAEWTIGGDILYVNGVKRPLRWMDKPSNDGVSFNFVDPLRMANADPHYTSGPLNRWYYWAATGVPAGDSPWLSGGYPYPAGAHAALKIWYHSILWYLGPESTYHDAAMAAHESAVYLYGTDSREVAAIDFAFVAINARTAEGLPPSVVEVFPSTAKPGERVRLTGSGFEPGSQVWVGERPVVVQPATDRQLTFLVPEDLSSGPVRVTNSYGRNAVMPELVVHQNPVIVSLEVHPKAFQPGDTVTVSWHTERAATTKLSGLGVPPSGRMEFSGLTATTDFRLEVWSAGGGYDSASVTAAFRSLDLDRDGKVTVYDVLQVVAAWGLPGETDFNGDGTTDTTDLNKILAGVR